MAQRGALRRTFTLRVGLALWPAGTHNAGVAGSSPAPAIRWIISYATHIKLFLTVGTVRGTMTAGRRPAPVPCAFQRARRSASATMPPTTAASMNSATFFPMLVILPSVGAQWHAGPTLPTRPPRRSTGSAAAVGPSAHSLAEAPWGTSSPEGTSVRRAGTPRLPSETRAARVAAVLTIR